jgi:DNA-directed RNA polymerase specialized sigma24 family protein
MGPFDLARVQSPGRHQAGTIDHDPDAERGLADAVNRIRGGDREAAADFVRRFEPLLRRRIRSRIGRAVRRVFDSEDIFSTVCRRLDEFVLSGSVRATTVPEMLSLIQAIAQRSVIDKARIVERLMRVEAEDGPLAYEILQHAGSGAQSDVQFQGSIERWAGHLDNPMDRLILFHWLWGEPQAATATHLGISHDLVRKRWQLIRERLKQIMADEANS